MIGLIRERYPTSGLIVITPAQCDNDAWMSWLRKLGYPPDQGLLHIHDNQVTRLYAKSVVQLCAELGVPCVDAFDAFEDTIRLGHTLADLLYDGLHYTPAGHQVSLFSPRIKPAPNHVPGHRGQVLSSHQAKLPSARSCDL